MTYYRPQQPIVRRWSRTYTRVYRDRGPTLQLASNQAFRPCGWPLPFEVSARFGRRSSIDNKPITLKKKRREVTYIWVRLVYECVKHLHSLPYAHTSPLLGFELNADMNVKRHRLFFCMGNQLDAAAI